MFDAAHARELPMFAGRTGKRISWSELQDSIAWADVIIVGEEHDDAVGHAVELAVVQDTLTGQSAGRAALSMEMLERDEQDVVDDFLDGIIDAATLEKLTLSTNWGGEGMWVAWYQPMLDCAKEHDARIVAANAPRRYVRLARTDGYERLRELPADRRKLFDLPGTLKDQGYLERFIEVMEGHDTAATQSAASAPATAPAYSKNSQPAERRSQAFVIEVMGPQLVWDATMAASIAQARRDGAAKIVHIIGQFHMDFNGGTVQELRRHLPSAKILTISMQRDEPSGLNDEDRDRADVVIYTGKRPPEPAEDAQPTTAPDVATQPSDESASTQPGA